MKITVGIGNLLALCLSIVTNMSLPWALIHGVCGWFYVAYWIVRRV